VQQGSEAHKDMWQENIMLLRFQEPFPWVEANGHCSSSCI